MQGMNAKDSTDRRAKTVQVFGCIWETQSIQNGQIKFSSNIFLIHTVLRSFGNPHGRTATTILFPFLLDLMYFFALRFVKRFRANSFPPFYSTQSTYRQRSRPGYTSVGYSAPLHYH